MPRASKPGSIIQFRYTFRKHMRTSRYRPGDLPVTEALADRFLSLPIYAELRPEQVAEVVQALENAHLVQAA